MGLANVIKGKIEQPEFILEYGPDGVGKSTFASEAPNPIFLGSEDGTGHLDTSRVSCPTFTDVMETLEDLRVQPHDYKTIVVDSLDWMEPLVWDHVCKEGGKKHIEDFGYGKGYVHAIDTWRSFISLLTQVRKEKQMHVILIAHSQLKRFDDPQHNEAYDRYVLKLNDKASALFREATDCVLFINYETALARDERSKKVRAFGGSEPILYTERRPAFDAKNRKGLPFEIRLPKGKSWAAYMEACERGREPSGAELVSQCRGLLENVRDVELKQKVDEELATAAKLQDLDMVKRVKQKLTTISDNA